MDPLTIQDLAAALLAVPPGTRRALAVNRPDLAPALDTLALARLAWPELSSFQIYRRPDPAAALEETVAEIVRPSAQDPALMPWARVTCAGCGDFTDPGLEDRDGLPHCEDCASARWEDWHEGER